MTTLTPTTHKSLHRDPVNRAEAVRNSLDAAIDALFLKQHPDGHWCAELEGDSILNSEYLLMKAILGQSSPTDAEGNPSDTPEKFEKICDHMRNLQRTDGTWGQYPGSGPDISATAKAYFALKLFGDDPNAEHMTRAREATLRLGGAERINTFSMFYFACLGQVSWNACPAIPPEIILLPRLSPFHLDKVAAWTRTMILPLAICSALRPLRNIPNHLGCEELFKDPSKRFTLNQPWLENDPISWTNLFLAADRALKAAQALGLTLGRDAAIARAHDWLIQRMHPDTTDGLGAIFPPMVYIQIALQEMGDKRNDTNRAEAEQQLERFIIEEPDHIRIQPCFSPVWDTGTALFALTEAGLNAESDPRIKKCCDWLLSKEVNLVGDWVRNLRPRDRAAFQDPNVWAAWAFEYKNDWYPDVDDTAMVAKALRRATASQGPTHPAHDATARAVRWMLAMQNSDGGWAAFDRTKDRNWMEAVPFADHNAMQDPSCPDITGRTLQALIICNVEPEHPAITRALTYLKDTQLPSGSWPGRWGVNALYGAWQSIGGLIAINENPDSPYLRKAARWLRSVQNPDGGFGETADSYIDTNHIGKGPSTASQTSWGAMALLDLTNPQDPAVLRAIDWLITHQLKEDAHPEPVRHATGKGQEDPARGWIDHPGSHTTPPALVSHPVNEPAGAWQEAWYTGTGFPKVFYLRYHLYRHYFPILTLAKWRNASQSECPA